MNSERNTYGKLFWVGLLLIGLKLGDVIDWSWWYVFMPWMFWPAVIILCAEVAGLVVMYEEYESQKKAKARRLRINSQTKP